MAFLVDPPNFRTKTKERIRKTHNVEMSQKIALIRPSVPKIPMLIGYPMNAVFAIITVTKILHSFLSEKLNCLKIKYETIPVINDDAIMTKGRIPKVEINDKSAE